VNQRLDKRYTVVPIVLVLTALAGFGLLSIEPTGDVVTSQPVTGERVLASRDSESRLLHQQFQQAVVLLQHREYDYAVQGFHEVLKTAPSMPEAHANMGFALLGLEEFDAARSFFDTATNLRPEQGNAYYGLAVAHEGLGELPQAVAAMRAYLQVVDSDDQYRRKAEAAIWEWEAKLAAENDER